MAGMRLGGGASAIVGVGSGGVPPLTASPAAPTSSQTISGIAFGQGNATPVGGTGGLGSLLAWDGPAIAFWSSLFFIGLGIVTYRSLPR
jgi:hypothetical protein